MSQTVNIPISDTATPVLQGLERRLTDRTGLNKYIAAAGEAGVRQHIRAAAASRHYTANKLQATPTGYLTKRAEMVEGRGVAEGAEIVVTGAIFRRVFGPVTVRATAAKMLTIPWSREAYGRRAREFNDLFVYVSKRSKGVAFLARREGKKLSFLFLLKRQVVLPQDRSLLPSNEQLEQVAELGARAYLKSEMRQLGVPG